MPKQVYKIDKFHGGLNSNSDPRDIAENELSAATDVMVDELGKIRTIGGSVSHSSETGVGSIAHTNEITPGYGLYAWNSDRTAANVISADYSGTHTGGDSDTAMIDGSGSFPLDALIGATINNTTDGSSGVITDNNATYVIVASLSGGSDNSWDDVANDAYTISDIPTTGANYLAFSDSDDTGTIMAYDMGSDSWGSPITGMTNVAGGTRKDVFYAADGNLRICDGNFENTNVSQWYGYIDKVFFKSITDTIIVDQWYQTAQEISAPDDTSEFDNIQPTTVAYTGGGDAYSNAADSATRDEITGATLQGGGVLNMMGGIEVTVRITTTAYGSTIPDFGNLFTTFTVTTGSWILDTNTFAGVLGVSHKENDITETAEFTASATKDVVYTFAFGDKYLGSGSIGDNFLSSESNNGVGTTLTDIVLGDLVASVALTNVKVTEATPTSPFNVQAKLTTGNVFMQILQKTPSDTTYMIPRGWDKEWEYGISFIYDEKQESLIRILFDSGNANKTELDNTDGPLKCPELVLYIDAGDATFNRRKTGAVWYIREASGGETANQWTAQVEFDFIKGVSRVVSSGKETNVLFNPYEADGNQYEFKVDRDHLLSPNLVDTYTSRTGVLRNETGIKARYKTAVMVGRRMYVGNVKTTDEGGVEEVKGDAMLKSPVNRFDTFPSLSVVEAAVNDGESIVTLEEFADRILQFKQQTLYIINVSQDIEFLEDVYKYKGVLHTAAVCKTDYGIAWVNRLGCYLYDGKQVINLLEKGGRQIIKESDWDSFTTDNSIIGYLPKKRQLIVLKDCTGTSVGDIFLYDMVTQSWVQGDSALTDSQEHTNFVNDSNGDLVWSHTSDTGTMRAWADASISSDTLSLKTKDIDFGHPGVRKKVYKVYLTYRGDGRYAKIFYGKDGLDPTLNFSPITSGADGSSTGGTADSSPLANAGTTDWLKAELKPTESINNISSFRLVVEGNTGGTAIDSAFEINDISIVYRLKPVK